MLSFQLPSYLVIGSYENGGVGVRMYMELITIYLDSNK
jgi:hypothetical protein